ncbi:MAG TPA: FHA domain-containing protein [bacterium]|nr:FHA domain-containing protein [bacterium]
MSGRARSDTRVYRPPAPGPRLRVLAGPPGEAGREFALDGPMVTIGRRPDQRIVLSDPSVSRSHARVEVGAWGVAIVDLGSTNGTEVNGHRLRDGRAVLRGGDRIRLGTVLLEFLAAR